MTVPVRRCLKKDIDKIVERLGKNAKFTEVPSTIPGVSFRGVISASCDEVSVAWPVDRPPEHQDDFAKKYNCGFPLDQVSIEPSKLSVVR
jgi:hypothetical protein